MDEEVLATLHDDVLRPSVVERAITLAIEARAPEREDERRGRVEAELADIAAAHAALTAAIARGGDVRMMVTLVERLQALEARRAQLATLGSTRRPIAPEPPAGLERRLRAKLADWRGLLTRDVASGREMLRLLLVGPLRFTPVVEERRRGYAFEGAIALDRLIAGEAVFQHVVRPQRDTERFVLNT